MSVRPAEPESEPALEPALALAPPTLAPTAMPASRLNFVLSVGRNERLRHEEASTAACELKPTWFTGLDYITGLPGAIGNVTIDRYEKPDNVYKISSLFENMPREFCSTNKCNHDFSVTEVTCTTDGKTATYAFKVENLTLKVKKNTKPVVTVDLNKGCGEKKAYTFDRDDYTEQFQKVLRGIAMYITKENAVSTLTKAGRFVAAKAKQVMPKKEKKK